MRRFFRVSLRSALMLIAVLCGFLAWMARDTHRAYHRSRLYAAVERLGGRAEGDGFSRPHGLSFANWVGSVWDERYSVPITRVDLNRLPIDDEDMGRIAALIEPLPEVLHLSAADTPIGDATVAALARCGMRELDLSRTQVTDAAAGDIARMHRLRQLSLTGTLAGEATAAAAASLPELIELNLSDTKLSDRGLSALAECQSLTRLSANGTLITDEAVLALQLRLPELHVAVGSLDLPPRSAWADATDFGLHGPFFGDGSLRRLDYSPKAAFVRLSSTRVSAKALARVPQRHQIRRLDLRNTQVDDDALAALAEWNSLETLTLQRTAITDDGLAHLAQLPRLQTLWIDGTSITDAGLVHLGKLSELRFLNLGGTSVDGSGLHHLAGLEKLERLLLDATPVTDDSLKNLPSLPGLLSLDVENTSITDGGLIHLRTFPKLRGVAARQSKVTVEGLQYFVDRDAERRVAAPQVPDNAPETPSESARRLPTERAPVQ